MAEKPMSISEFMERFSTEEVCEKELLRLKWPDGFTCPRCGHRHFYAVSGRNYPLYQCASCRHQTTSLAGTVFEKTHVPLAKWFSAIYQITKCKTGYSCKQLSDEIGVSIPTAWLMLHKLRSAMAEGDSRYMLSGTVSVDESFIGASAGDGDERTVKRGRGTAKNKVLGAVQTARTKTPAKRKGCRSRRKNTVTHPVYIKLAAMEQLNRKTVHGKINEWIRKGSTVRTDKLNIYMELDGYTHIAEKSDAKGNPEHLMWYHTLIGNLQNLIVGTHHGVSVKHLQRYLDEFSYRFNRRHLRSGIFDRLIKLCARIKTTTLAELT